MVVTGRAVLLTVAALAALVAVTFAYEAHRAPPLSGVAAAYGRTADGPGLGASLTMEWSLRHLDPRLERGSTCDLYPIPGGPGFCPNQGAGLFQPPDDGVGAARVEATVQRE